MDKIYRFNVERGSLDGMIKGYQDTLQRKSSPAPVELKQLID